MNTLNYNTAFEHFLNLITEYDFLNVDEEYIASKENEWTRHIIGMPKVRRLFTSISLNAEEQTIEYSMKNSGAYDEDFIIDLLALGYVILWLEPYVNSTLNLKQVFSGKEEKFYSQSAHLSQVQELYKLNYQKFDKHIRDYGSYFNGFVKD